MNFQTSINLNKFELQNARIQNLAVAPSVPVEGQIYYSTAAKTTYYFDGTGWNDMGGDIRDVVGTLPIVVNVNNGVATISINTATQSAPGSMSASDKLKLDSATHSNIFQAIVQRDISGNIVVTQLTATKVTGLAEPVNPSDAATKNYVDLATQGLDAKLSVRAATTTNITLSGTQNVDGVVLAVGNRILVKNQITASQNGIYIVAAGAWTRATDLATGASASGVYTFIEEGTSNADSGWLCINDMGADVVGTGSLSFTQFSGAGQVIAGNGLVKTGNTLDIVPADASIDVQPDSIAVKHDTADGSTETTATGIRVKNGGITAAKIAAAAIGTGLQGGAGTPVSVQNYTPVASTTVARAAVATINIGGGTPVTITHNMNTRFVNVQVQDAVTNEVIIADVTTSSVNAITVTGAGATLSVRVTIIG